MQQKTVEISQAQFLVVWEVVDMPVCVQRQVPCSWTKTLIFHVKVDSDPEAASMEFHGSSHLKFVLFLRSCIWQSMRQSACFWKNFIFSTCRFSEVHAQGRTGNMDIFSYELSGRCSWRPGG